MRSKNIETFIGCDNEYEESKTVIFGAPFDSTTSFRPGTRFASKVMRSESFGIETYSPYQDKDLEDIAVFDGGDLELSFGNTEKALAQIEKFAAEVLEDNKIPCMIGGEHLVTLGAVRAAAKKYPDLHIIQFDAHTDLRDDYLGEPLSHATVIRRVWDMLGDGKIFQFGIRSGDRNEFQWGKDHVFTNKFNFAGLETVVEKLQGKPVYLTIDLDVLDPSVFPGTGTPEAGGVSFIELLNAMLAVSGLNIVGCDINELSPVYDQSGVSTAAACKVLRELLLMLNSK
ncbi:agmatinase [Bacillus sp. FJAT-50079]|uniref:agmatinase n=1 Tax=Bacillus sp. FJAT-50079 TaxID=2833577 RepID=UPI001BC916B5|nr:agmatinase [Bacillus sp. FJAT-50079]MBS4209723.1 agmatinase [Bacillus sp. FJAT-50079]